MFDMLEATDELLEEGLDPVLRMRMALTELTAEDRDSWPGPALSERVLEVLGLQERFAAEVLRLVGRWDRDRAWEADGSLSASSWLAHRTPMALAEAKRLAKTARLIDRHDRLGAALANDETTAAHVDSIAKVVSKDREPLFAEHEATLVDLAKNLPIPNFNTTMRRWASLADDELARGSEEQKWGRRHLHASKTLDGWGDLSGFLDPAGYVAVVTALDDLAPPDPADAPDGPRSLSQRRADALVDLSNWYLTGAKPNGNPPNLNVVVDVATLNGQKPSLAMARCDLEGVGPVTRATLEQLTCGATVTRVVMAGESVILDMGRAKRLATPAQRRALTIRDRHCRFTGCHRPAQWCDAHHIDGWFDENGPTDLDNLVLLCRRHHTLIHNSRWTITRTAVGEFQFTHPARGP